MTPLVQRVRIAAVAARDGLRLYWGTALLITITGIVALAAALPVTSLVGPGAITRLGLATARGLGLSLPWTDVIRTPAATQEQAVALLFGLLLCTAAAALAMGGLTILGLAAVRASQRTTDVSVRRAVGASRRGLVATALLEGGTIAAVTVVIGCGIGALAAFAARLEWPGLVRAGANAPWLVTALLLGGGIVVGMLLSLASARHRGLVQTNGKPLQLYVPAVQLGLSLMVLTAGGLFTRHAASMMQQSETAAGNGLVYAVSAPDAPLAERAATYAALLDRLADSGRFSTVSLTSPGALVGLGTVTPVMTDCGLCPSANVLTPYHFVSTTHQFVSADTFRTAGLHVIAGRGITSADTWNAPRVAVVSRGLALRHFQRGEAVGRQMQVGDDPNGWYTVVGIVDDRPGPGFGVGLQPPFTVYLSILQHPALTADLLVRAAPGVTDRVVRSTVAGLLGGTAHAAPTPEASLLAAEAAPLAWFGRWLGIEGWALLLIAAAGTFVLMRLWVLSLRHELGVRRAMGARRRHLLGFIMLRAVGTALAGVAIGAVLGPAGWSSVTGVVKGLPSWDTGLVLRFAALLLVTTLAGALIPAWQAAWATPRTLLDAEGD